MINSGNPMTKRKLCSKPHDEALGDAFDDQKNGQNLGLAKLDRWVVLKNYEKLQRTRLSEEFLPRVAHI
jgi:hypothetical protein